MLNDSSETEQPALSSPTNVPANLDAAPHHSPPAEPGQSDPAAAEADDAPSSPHAESPAAAAPSSPHKADSHDSSSADSSSAKPQSSESSPNGPQHLDSASGVDQSQPSQQGSTNASSVEEEGSALTVAGRAEGLSAGTPGAGGSNGEPDDDAASVRSQDTTTSRSSKLQASEMSRLQVT